MVTTCDGFTVKLILCHFNYATTGTIGTHFQPYMPRRQLVLIRAHLKNTTRQYLVIGNILTKLAMHTQVTVIWCFTIFKSSSFHIYHPQKSF